MLARTFPLAAALALLLAASGRSAAQEVPAASSSPAVSGAAQQPPGFPERRRFETRTRVETRYDRFRDSTRVSLSLPGGFLADRGIIFSFSFAGRTPAAPPESFMLHLSERVFVQRLAPRADGTLAPRPRPVFILVGDSLRFRDAEPLQEIVHPVDQKFATDVRETVTAVFPLRALLAMAASDRAEMQIDQSAIRLSDDHLEALRDFASRANPAVWTTDEAKRWR
jgi:hypothetical protein